MLHTPTTYFFFFTESKVYDKKLFISGLFYNNQFLSIDYNRYIFLCLYKIACFFVASVSFFVLYVIDLNIGFGRLDIDYGYLDIKFICYNWLFLKFYFFTVKNLIRVLENDKYGDVLPMMYRINFC